VFLQGCDFDCKVCHNPHTIPLASTKATTMSVDDVLARLRETMPFVSGLTVSGGEATLQWQFVRDLFAAVRESQDLSGLSTMVDSNGNADPSVWRELAPVMDGAMIDLKALDPQTHLALTGKPNEPVLESIRTLAGLNRLAEVRLLLIPGRNDSDEELTRTARWLAGIDPNIPVRLNLFMTHGVRMPARSWQPADPEDRPRYEAVLQAAT
jgi:pyruvate formate lyase activating enzyme